MIRWQRFGVENVDRGPADPSLAQRLDAAVTVFGDLTGRRPASPQAAALDLVRAYAHDCLHYATFRRYRLTDRGEIARVQYGINFRQPDGRTYSAPDVPRDGPTRNLGIVMEGATDAEATGIARQAAQSCGITSADLGAACPAWLSPTSRVPSASAAPRPRSCRITLMPGPLPIEVGYSRTRMPPPSTLRLSTAADNKT
jgi:hypothetical protein